MKKPVEDHYILFTNLNYVTIGSVRTSSHALLLSQREAFLARGTPEFILAGFAIDASIPTFDIRVPSIEYKLEDAASSNIAMLHDDGSIKPLCSGAILTIEGFEPIQLVSHTRDQPIHVDIFAGEDAAQRAQSVLPLRVHQFWAAPGMPAVAWMRREQILGFLKATGGR